MRALGSEYLRSCLAEFPKNLIRNTSTIPTRTLHTFLFKFWTKKKTDDRRNPELKRLREGCRYLPFIIHTKISKLKTKFKLVKNKWNNRTSKNINKSVVLPEEIWINIFSFSIFLLCKKFARLFAPSLWSLFIRVRLNHELIKNKNDLRRKIRIDD